ncbi:TVG1527611 [Thermoplasma volcanium GSS1]|uniref:TVG1527611 protein n=1 Tax=Thermoplasma volcanium (strain ATCC 51530 / DSM 4299 / JCM 9571 / NBRC 15438 / GSS1) TaxID=273116 RepID=Q978E1_THEVO|nr:SHOCT domain-containing protein [Thermoplasma volcanium]BAB60618.1 TVG1527611 [Thermoplasma volcanium GSS1]
MDKKVENFAWLLIGIIALIAVVVFVYSIFAGGTFYSFGYGPRVIVGGLFGWWLIMPIFAFFVMIFFVIMMFSSHGHDHWHNNRMDFKRSRAEDIARERFAKGEITEDQYNRIINEIRR